MDSKISLIDTCFNRYFRESYVNDARFDNVYVDNDNIMRSIFGYKTIFQSNEYGKILKTAIDRTNKYIYIITTLGFYIFSGVNFNTYVFFSDWLGIAPSDFTSITETAEGNVVVTNGGLQGLFLVDINRNSLGNIIEARMRKFNYNLLGDNSNKIQYPTSLTYLDSKICLIDKYKGTFAVINNIFSDTPALVEFFIQSIPCNAVALVRAKRALYVIGTKCTEIWFSSQDEAFLQRYNNVLYEVGTIYPDSISVVNGILIFLSQNDNSSPSLIKIDTNKPNEEYIEQNNLPLLFEQLTTKAIAVADNFSPSDLNFYVLSVEDSESFTIMVDIDKNRVYTITGKKTNTRFPANQIIWYQQSWYLIMNDGFQIAEFNDQYAEFDGEPIPIVFNTSVYSNDGGIQSIGLKAIEMALRPIPEYFEDYKYNPKKPLEMINDTYKLYGRWSLETSSNKNLSDELLLANFPKGVFVHNITNGSFPKGRKHMQFQFRILLPRIEYIENLKPKYKYLPLAVKVMNLVFG